MVYPSMSISGMLATLSARVGRPYAQATMPDDIAGRNRGSDYWDDARHDKSLVSNLTIALHGCHLVNRPVIASHW